MEAFQKIPEDVLHSLRVLGMVSGCQGDTMSYSHDGIQPNGVPTPGLEDAVCTLKEILPGDYPDSFMVFDYGMYPPLTFIDRGEAHNKAFQWMVDKVESQYNPPYYLLIGKQINPEDASVEFRVKLKLPREEVFADMNTMLETGFQDMVRDAVISEYNSLNNLILISSGEIAGIDKLRELLSGFLDESITGELDDALLFTNGFFPVPGSPSNIDTTGQPLLSGDVFDYAGLGIDEGNGSYSVRNNISSVISGLNWSAFAILTDDRNYSNGNGEDFEAAIEAFNSADEKIVFWFHYHISSDSTSPPQVFLKLRNNFTLSEAEQLAEEYWNAYLALFPAGDGGGGVARPGRASSPCPDWPVVDILSWRTNGQNGDNLLNCVEEIFPVFFGISYAGGVACGIADGVLDNVSFLADIAHGLIDFARYGHVVLPSSGFFPNIFDLFWLTDLTYRAIKKEVVEKGWFEFWGWDLNFGEAANANMKDGIQYWNKINAIYDAITKEGFIREVFNTLKTQFFTWLGNVSGANGSKIAGHEHGKIIFDVLLGVVTGGGSATKELTQIAKKNIGDLIDALDAGNFSGFIAQKWDNIADGIGGIKCKILYNGCFVRNTPVLLAGATGIMAVPIQNIQPFDYVLAHTTVNHTYGLTASTDNTFTGLASEDLYTSTQQKQRDQFELNETDWYEVSFKELHGGGYCKLALHKDWMNQHGMNEVGSIHDLNLPEQGISGPNIITAIKHILPQKIPADENPTDNYETRPVTGIFVHQSNDVWTLRFDNGDSLGVTFNHPIYSAIHRDWRLAGELEPGERLLAKSGEVTLASKEKLPGTHTVYNLEVRELHNFLVGGDGVVVHNLCWGEVTDFLNLPLQKKLDEIVEWWAGKYPKIFERGNFFEALMRKKKFKDWNYTGVPAPGDQGLGISNFWLIDFYKDIPGGKKVASMKTTINSDVGTWLTGANKTHVNDLATRLNSGSFPSCKQCANPTTITGVTKVELHVFVQKGHAIPSNQASWQSAIDAEVGSGKITVILDEIEQNL